MNKYIGILGIISLSGCGMFGVQSPRPDKAQLEATKVISEKSVPVIVGAQTDKQKQIASIAKAGFDAISFSTVPVQPTTAGAITNIAANAIKGVLESDGTAKILAQGNQKTMNDILKMSTAEYLAYTAAQGIVASGNREIAMEGIKKATGFIQDNWGWMLGIFFPGAGALVAAKKASTRGKFLRADAEVIKDFIPKTQGLKEALTSKHSKIVGNAKKEHGLI